MNISSLFLMWFIDIGALMRFGPAIVPYIRFLLFLFFLRIYKNICLFFLKFCKIIHYV
jgi:hypothetical protein